jgi:hypothetical protein
MARGDNKTLSKPSASPFPPCLCGGLGKLMFVKERRVVCCREIFKRSEGKGGSQWREIIGGFDEVSDEELIAHDWPQSFLGPNRTLFHRPVDSVLTTKLFEPLLNHTTTTTTTTTSIHSLHTIVPLLSSDL